MIDFILQAGLSNAGFSLILAIVALVVGSMSKRPHLAYLLWLLVLVKLVTPPMYAIPIDSDFFQSRVASESMTTAQPESNSDMKADLGAVSQQLDANEEELTGAAGSSIFANAMSRISSNVGGVLVFLWVLGSLITLCWSLFQVFRFNRLLSQESKLAPEELQTAAQQIANSLEMKTVPAIHVTSARLSPLVWWFAGKVLVIIPAELLKQMDVEKWHWILAHELAHVRRKDYMVRWLEWLACTLFWWNPVVWWAQRNLRATEEICCDALVLGNLNPKPRTYVNSLLTAVEFLSYPVLNPPAMASEINSGGFFLRRCKMIVSKNPNRLNPLWVKGLVILFAIVVLPLGAHLSANDKQGKKHKPDQETEYKQQAKADAYYKETWAKLMQSVDDGNLTEGEAHAKFESIKMTMYAEEAEKASIDARIGATKIKLGYAVKAGNISETDAKTKLEAIHKEIEMSAKHVTANQGEFFEKWNKQLTLYFEGYISLEDVQKETYKLEMDILPDFAAWNLTDEYAKYLSKMQKGVLDDKITTPEAINWVLAAEQEAYGQACEKLAMEYNLKEIGIELQTKVDAGKITQEEADAKMEHIAQSMEADLASDDEKKKQASTKDD